MTIREIIENTPAVKVRLITYARDGQTVVVHHLEAHHIVDNFYVYQTKADEYGNYSFLLIALFPCRYGVQIGNFVRFDENQEKLPYRTSLIDDGIYLPVPEYVRKVGADYRDDTSFLRKMDANAANNAYIKKSEIRLAKEMLRSTPDHGEAVLNRYNEAREKRMAEIEERERIKEEQLRLKAEAEEKRRRDEWESRISHVVQKLMAGGKDIPIDADVMFEIIKRTNVDVPISVKGWMRRNMTAVSIEKGRLTGYRYRKTTSETVYSYFDRILEVLRREHPHEENQDT